MLPPALDKVATLLSRLPGVGKRTAMRWAFYLLNEPASYAESLRVALGELRERVHFCERCHNLAETTTCPICQDPNRDRTLVCVVESVADLMAIERSGGYRGCYHVLHGALAPLKGIGPGQLRLGNLEQRIHDEGIGELILATSADVEGEATALYLAKRLKPLGIGLSRIATGVPMGGELEYLDEHTVSRALAARVKIE